MTCPPLIYYNLKLDSPAAAPRALSAALACLAGERIVCAERADDAGDGAGADDAAEGEESFAFAPFTLEAVALRLWLSTQRALGPSATQRIATLLAGEAEEDPAALDYADAAAASTTSAAEAMEATEPAHFQWTFETHALLVEYVDALCDAAGIDNALELDASLVCSALSPYAPLGTLLNRATTKRFAVLGAISLRGFSRFIVCASLKEPSALMYLTDLSRRSLRYPKFSE